MNLWNDNDSMNYRVADSGDLVLIDDSCSQEKLECSQTLIRNYSILLEQALNSESKVLNEGIYMLKLCLSLAHKKNGTREDLRKSLSLAESLVSNSNHRYKQLGYFIISSARYQSFRFRECKVAAEAGNEMFTDNDEANEVLYWVNSDSVPIDITLPGRLRKGFENFLSLCENPIPPCAICRYVPPVNADPKKRFHTYPEMYEQEPDYKGYIQYVCTQKCVLQYHVQCWKFLKEDMDISNEKEFLGSKCLTPDCDAPIFKVYLMNKDQAKNKCFEISKEEAKNKIDKKLTLPRNNAEESKRKKRTNSISTASSNHSNITDSLSGICNLNPDKDNLILELLSKVESLSQKVHQVKVESKENKSDIEAYKSLMEKLKGERKKFQDEVKAFQNEQKAWKKEKLKFEQNFSTLQNTVEVMNSIIESERTSRKELEATLTSVMKSSDENLKRTHNCQISSLKQKRDLGLWILSWAMSLSEQKINTFLSGNTAEEIVKHALTSLQELSDKQQAFKLSLDEQISNIQEHNDISKMPDIPIPVSMELISSLLNDVLVKDSSPYDKVPECDEPTCSNPMSSLTSSSASPEPNIASANMSTKQFFPSTSTINSHTSYFADSVLAAETFRNSNNQKPSATLNQSSNFNFRNLPNFSYFPQRGSKNFINDENSSGSSSQNSLKSHPKSRPETSENHPKLSEAGILCSNLEDTFFEREQNGKCSNDNDDTSKGKSAAGTPSLVKESFAEWRNLAKKTDTMTNSHRNGASKLDGVLIDPNGITNLSNFQSYYPSHNSTGALSRSFENILANLSSSALENMSVSDPIKCVNNEYLSNASDAKNLFMDNYKKPNLKNEDMRKISGSSASADNLSHFDVNDDGGKAWNVFGAQSHVKSNHSLMVQSGAGKIAHQSTKNSAEEETNAQSNVKISQRKKLAIHLKKHYPNYSEEELSGFVKEVRKGNNNSLTGLTMEVISHRVGELIKFHVHEAHRSNNSINKSEPVNIFVARPAPTAPWHKLINQENSKWQPDPNTNSECAVCQEEMTPGMFEQLDCGHSFHKACIKTWLNEQKTCPVCRVHTLPNEDYPILG